MLFLDLHIFIFTFPDLVLCHFELYFWEIIISQLTYFAVISTLTDFVLYYFKIYKFYIEIFRFTHFTVLFLYLHSCYWFINKVTDSILCHF